MRETPAPRSPETDRQERQERPPPLGAQLPLWPGAAPGSETWTWPDQVLPTDDGRLVRNVAVATLEAIPPPAAPTEAVEPIAR